MYIKENSGKLHNQGYYEERIDDILFSLLSTFNFMIPANNTTI